MGHTNSTANLGLPQFIGTDKPTWLSDVNGAFAAIDTYAGNNDAALAITDAKADTAVNDAASAVTTATNAANTAGTASTQATNAVTVAGNALTVANGINSKVGVLTDLTTTDKSTVVNAINEVNGKDAGDIAYDNTGSGLTATNVQDAIDEVAQGGGGGGTSAWTLLGTATGTTSVNLPGTWNELCLVAAIGGNDEETVSIVIPQAAYTEGAKYHSGWSAGGGSYGEARYLAGASAINLNVAYSTGVDATATTTSKIYYR